MPIAWKTRKPNPELEDSRSDQELRERVLGAISISADAHFRQLGISIERPEIDWDSTFAVDDRVFVRWSLSGKHSVKDASLGGLGFERTFQPVTLEVFTLGTVDQTGKLDGLRHRYDSLALLGQLGIKAMGRPVLEMSRDALTTLALESDPPA